MPAPTACEPLRCRGEPMRQFACILRTVLPDVRERVVEEAAAHVVGQHGQGRVLVDHLVADALDVDLQTIRGGRGMMPLDPITDCTRHA